MMQRPVRLPHHRSFAAALAMLFTCVAATDLPAAPTDFRLAIVPGEYAIGFVHFADAADVEAWLRANDGRVAAIDRCASAPTPQLVAAVERLDGHLRDVVELRTLPTGAPGCAGGGVPSAAGDFVGWLRAADYTATDEHGRSMIP